MRDGIFIAAAPGSTWPLSLDSFAARLRARWADVVTVARHAAATNQDYLAFEVDLEGERRHGSFFDGRYLVLEDGTPSFWADTMAWFLSLLPVDASVVCMTESVPEPVPLARQASSAEIVAVLESIGA
jgi:hypothetical protein